jgi:hypothetical protein
MATSGMMKRLISIVIGMIAIFSISACDGCHEEPSGEIKGTVYFMQYQPLINAVVRTEPPTTSVMTDNYAHFSIPNVRPGLYKVIAEFGTANSGNSSVTVNPGKSFSVVVIVRPKSLQRQ